MLCLGRQAASRSPPLCVGCTLGRQLIVLFSRQFVQCCSAHSLKQAYGSACQYNLFKLAENQGELNQHCYIVCIEITLKIVKKDIGLFFICGLFKSSSCVVWMCIKTPIFHASALSHMTMAFNLTFKSKKIRLKE